MFLSGLLWTALISNSCAANSKNEHSKVAARSRSSIRFPEKRQNAKYSQDGKCGPANGNLLCDPNSTVYEGTCCSQYGWCGGSPAHCGDGCQSGCNNGAEPTVVTPVATPKPETGATAPRDDGRCGKDFNGATCDANGAYGGCCSSYGYCGNTDGHCLIADGCQNGCKDAPTTTDAPALFPPIPALRPPQAQVNPFLVSPRALSTPSLPVCPLLTEAAAQNLAVQSAVTGRKALAVACTDTVVSIYMKYSQMGMK